MTSWIGHRCAATLVASVLSLAVGFVAPAIAQQKPETPTERQEPRRAPSGEREHYQLKAGISYEQGDYGTGDESRAIYAPLTFKYLGERFDVGLTVPWLYLESEEGVTQVDGDVTRGRGRGQGRRGRERDVSAAGLGDISLKGRWFLLDDQPASWIPALTPFARIKFPTADEDRNLGTGEADFGFGVEFDKQFGRTFVFGDVSYTVIGDPPGEDFRNRPGVSLGVGYDVTPTLTASAQIDWRRALVSGSDDPVDLIATLAIRLSRTVSIIPSLVIGLTNGSPDFGLGVEVTYKFGRY